MGEVDALVLPSRRGSEGSPNVVLEAFARRVPVIGSSDPPIGELLGGDRGTVFRAGDSAALKEAILSLRSNPRSAEERAMRAFAYVRERHSWPSVVEAWERFLVTASATDLSAESKRPAGTGRD